MRVALKALQYQTKAGDLVPAGAVVDLPPDEAAALVAGGMADFVESGEVRTAMAVGPAARSAGDAAKDLAEAKAVAKSKKGKAEEGKASEEG